MKNQFAILTMAPHYNMDIQARFAPALAAIHNFICLYDHEEIEDLIDDTNDMQPGARTGDLVVGPARGAEKALAESKCDAIAHSMWDQYQAELANRGVQ
jgi:hypothetical protein